MFAAHAATRGYHIAFGNLVLDDDFARLELERVNPGPTALILILFIDMKLVQKAMHDGREHDPHHGDENQSAKQRVQ